MSPPLFVFALGRLLRAACSTASRSDRRSSFAFGSLALAIVAGTALVFAAFGMHVAGGGAYEMRTVGALALRLVVWGLISDRMHERRWNLLIACLVSAVGLVMAGGEGVDGPLAHGASSSGG